MRFKLALTVTGSRCDNRMKVTPLISTGGSRLRATNEAQKTTILQGKASGHSQSCAAADVTPEGGGGGGGRGPSFHESWKTCCFANFEGV